MRKGRITVELESEDGRDRLTRIKRRWDIYVGIGALKGCFKVTPR